MCLLISIITGDDDAFESAKKPKSKGVLPVTNTLIEEHTAQHAILSLRQARNK
jgi:hypothetical protein